MKKLATLIVAGTFAAGHLLGQSPAAPALGPQTIKPTSRLTTNQILIGLPTATKCSFIGFTKKHNLAFSLMNDAGVTIGMRIVERITGKILNSMLLTDSDPAKAGFTWTSMHSQMPDGRLLICLVSQKGNGIGIGSKKIHLVLIDEQVATLKATSLNYEDPESSTWSSEKSIHRGAVCVQALAINGKIAVINNYYLAMLDPVTLRVEASTVLPDGGEKLENGRPINFLGGCLLESGGIWRSLHKTKGFRCSFGKPAELISGDEYKRLEAEVIPWNPWARKGHGNMHPSKPVGGLIEVKPASGGSLQLDTGEPQLAGDSLVYERDGVCLIACRDSKFQETGFIVLSLPKM